MANLQQVRTAGGGNRNKRRWRWVTPRSTATWSAGIRVEGRLQNHVTSWPNGATCKAKSPPDSIESPLGRTAAYQRTPTAFLLRTASPILALYSEDDRGVKRSSPPAMTPRLCGALPAVDRNEYSGGNRLPGSRSRPRRSAWIAASNHKGTSSYTNLPPLALGYPPPGGETRKCACAPLFWGNELLGLGEPSPEFFSRLRHRPRRTSP